MQIACYNICMLVLSNRIFSCHIMSLQTGAQIGEVVETIIDPRQLLIVAFRCEGPGIDFEPAILHTTDIREFGTMGIIVNSSDDLMPPDDLVRLQEVMDFKFKLIDKQVVDETGQKLGKVIDFAVETDSFFITQLHVQPPLLKSFGTVDLIINRTQITNVTNKKIVVKSGLTKTQTHTVNAKEDFENPFKRPQTEVTQMHQEKN